MKVTINGENIDITDGLNLRQLLEKLELPTERVAVELNRDVVRKKDWDEIRVSDEDKIEIIHFVGGG
jgi:thiamine biosynthesis protein ThiS